MRKGILLVAISSLLVLAIGGSGMSAELVMFESDSCEWCEAWHDEIGVVYHKTQEARIAPLRRVSTEDPVPEDLAHIRGIHYTPTFVLMEDGREVGRILGYPGEDFFWGLLALELDKLKPAQAGIQAQAGGPGCAERLDEETQDEKTGDSAAAC